MCVIILDTKKPEKTYLDALKEANSLYDRKISRGSQFKFMWLDAQREEEWAKIFNVESYPAVVVLNPGKRKRYLLHEGSITTNAISSYFLFIVFLGINFRKFLEDTLDKINGGDAHFTQIKLAELPEFVHLKD